MKPLFHMIAPDGPWEYHVKASGSVTYVEIIDWLNTNGFVRGQHWQYIKDNTGCSPSPEERSKRLSKTPQVLRWIFFFNDPKIATYIKMTWGGK